MEKQYQGIIGNIYEKAKSLEKPKRVAIAGADNEPILKGVFMASEEGIVYPILIGNKAKIENMLAEFGLADKEYEIHNCADGDNVVQYGIDMLLAGYADILMRGNTQTRDFLMPILYKANHLIKNKLVTQVDLLNIPGVRNSFAVSDCTIVIEPSLEQKKEIIKNMVEMLQAFGVTKPNIALLSLVEKPSFHMRDSVEAFTLADENKREPFADCNLVGPIPYDLIVSKEAARLKNYDDTYSGEFDGIVVPTLLAGNLLVKILQHEVKSNSIGLLAGTTKPIVITSRSAAPEEAYLSVCAAAVL